MLKREKTLVFILFIASVVSSREQQCSPCDSLLNRGDSLYRRFFQNREALQIYLQARVRCPDCYEALMKTTRAYIDVGEDKESTADFRKAMEYAQIMQEKYPDSGQSYFLMAAAAGNLAQKNGGRERVRLSRAVVQNTKRAIELMPSYSPAYVILGAYYREVALAGSFEKFIANLLLGGIPDGTLADSEEYLQKAIELDSTNMYGHFEIAKAYIANQKNKLARYHLEKVLQLPIDNNESPRLKDEAEKLLKNLD